MKVFKSSLPLYLVIILICGAFAGGKLILGEKQAATTQVKVENCPGTMQQIRLEDYEFVHPLLLTDVPEESESLNEIKSKVLSYINQAQSSAQADEVSVYFRRLNNGAYFCINPNTTYNPASMIKIVYLITYIKMIEKNPAVINQKIYFERHYSQGNNQNIKDFELKERTNYSVKELLLAMIMHSDNDATMLLSQNMNNQIYNKIFTDLDIPIPNPAAEYFINATDFSKFFRVLYSAAYSNTDLSEFALELLTKSTFQDGLRKGLEPNVVMAHKFGERIIGQKAQLHEFGIVFYKGSPYLIGVMTKGNALPQLSQIIGDISRIAFDNYKALANS